MHKIPYSHIPNHISTTHNTIPTYQKIQEEQEQGNLFSKLKHDIIMMNNRVHHQVGEHHGREGKGRGDVELGEVLDECELELEILKLQMANFVAGRVWDFGEDFQDMMQKVERNIGNQIQQILFTKYPHLNPNPKQKPSPTPSTTHTASHTLSSQTQKKAPQTPKIVQFTLGNRRVPTSAGSSSPAFETGEQVSEFFAAPPRAPASRNIREKVIGKKGKLL